MKTHTPLSLSFAAERMLASLQAARDAGDVDRCFAAIGYLGQAEYGQVIDEVEEDYVRRYAPGLENGEQAAKQAVALAQVFDNIARFRDAPLMGQVRYCVMEMARFSEDRRPCLRVMCAISEAKGRAAHPFIRAVTEEVARAGGDGPMHPVEAMGILARAQARYIARREPERPRLRAAPPPD